MACMLISLLIYFRRPLVRVEPLSYGPAPKVHQREGLYVRTVAGAAFDVEVEPVQLRDGWRLRFEESLSRIEGDAFFTALVQRGSVSTFHLLEAWTSLMLSGELPRSFPLRVRYRDAKGNAWKTICEIRRDNRLSPSGFDVRLLRVKRFCRFPSNAPKRLK
jgi:hypothetical protein